MQNTGTKTLLVVDDEKRVVDVLLRTFRDVYDVHGFLNAPEALAAIPDLHAQVILTDEKMPDMNGLSFLRKARDIQPGTVNIMLTAYSDQNLAINAINSGLVYRYLIKPWDTDELCLTVRQAFEYHMLLETNRRLTGELTIKNTELEKNLSLLQHTQSRLVQSERLTVVGQLTASIGHELRNPLSRIKTAASLLKSEFGREGGEVQDLLNIVENEVVVSDKIINDLLDFSKDRKSNSAPVHINEIITSSLERTRLSANVSVQTELGKDLPMVLADSGQLQQILVNLILNGSQAMVNGGILKIWSHASGSHISVHISDTGTGIKPSDIPRVFEPLYTTRAKGIGLGMSVVKMLVERNNGTIQIESQLDMGTTVTLTFPISQ